MKHIPYLSHERSKATLCVIHKSHAPLLTRWINDEDVRQYLMRFAPVMLEGEEKWLSDMALGSATMRPITDAMFLIVVKDTQKPIGCMGLHQIDWKNRRATTGTFIGEEQWRGKSFGTHAKMLLLRWAFDELGLNKIESRAIAFNERSQAYSRRCGYVEVGRLKQHIFRGGVYHDEVILEVYASEWRKVWKQFELAPPGGSLCNVL